MSEKKIGVGVACFVWKDGMFLVQQRYGAHGAGTWSIPGGNLELNESWSEGAAREVLEETGMHIQNIRFMAVTNDIFSKEDKHYVTIWMEADWAEGEPTITEPDKCLAQEWRDFHSLPSPLFEPCWQNLRETKPELFV